MTHFLCMREKRPSFFFESASSTFFFLFPLLCCFGGGCGASVVAEPGLENALLVDSAVDALELAADDKIVLAVSVPQYLTPATRGQSRNAADSVHLLATHAL